MCLLAAGPAQAACTALTDGVVPFFRLSPTGSGTVFTESTSTAIATVEGAIAYDTTNDVLKVCDGTNWLDAGTGGGASSGDAGYVQLSDGSGGFTTSGTTAGQQFFWDNTNKRLGIGTATPSRVLDVLGSGTIYTMRLQSPDSAVTLQLTPATGSSWGQIENTKGQLYITNSETNGFGFISLRTGGTNERVRITHTGSVGIGTSTPSYFLSLAGNTARTVGMERHTTADTAGNSLTVLAGGATSGASNKAGGDLVLSSGTATGTGSSKIEFKTHPAGSSGTADTTATTAMTILGNGNVGVGTSNPQFQLEVSGVAIGSAVRSTIFNSDNTSSASSAGLLVQSGGASAGDPYINFRLAGVATAGGNWMMGIDNSDADKFKIASSASGLGAGSDFLTIDPNSNVGIGTTTPNATLDVYSASGTAFRVIQGGGTRTLTFENGIYTNTTLSVGAATPQAAGFYANSGTPSRPAIVGQGYSGQIADIFQLRTPFATTGDILTVQAGGSIGIGTSNPEAKADIIGAQQGTITTLGSEVPGLVLQQRTSGIYGPMMEFRIDNGAAVYTGGAIVGTSYSSYGGGLSFYTQAGGFTDTSGRRSAGGSLVERLTIVSNGNVGIGTTGPDSKLYVLGTKQTVGSYNYGVLTVADNSALAANVGGAIAFQGKYTSGGAYATGASIAAYKANATDGDNSFGLQFNTRNNGSAPAARMTIDNQGNVGIGTSAPNQGRVEVKGGTVCVDTDSDDNATSCITTESDARLKTNVQALDVSLDTFMKLRPVSFDWKHDDAEVLKHYPLIGRFADHPHSIGMIAQEVQALVPEAIMPETVGDAEVQYLQLDYTKLVPVLIKALQDVKREKDVEIEALTKRLEVLERIILTPETRLQVQQ